MTTEHSVRSFSTHAVPAGMRFDYWMSILRQSLWPVTEWSELPPEFNVSLREASLGRLSVMTETICAHLAHRTKTDVKRTEEHTYHLFANVGKPFQTQHNGHSEHLLAGDVVLMGHGEHKVLSRGDVRAVLVKCPADWIRTWLPDPNAIAGRKISKDSKWGRVLAPMVSQLTPELAIAPPLPHPALVDQLGTVLALFAGETEARAMPDMLAKVKGIIRERCHEPKLTADDVATSLKVPPRILHRALVASGLTFASLLLDARVAVALDLLCSHTSKSLTAPEIARRAGFTSPALFARAVLKRTGLTPLQLRPSVH